MSTGVLLPGESKKVDVAFSSLSSGIFTETWRLATVPPLDPAPELNLFGSVTRDDRLASSRAEMLATLEAQTIRDAMHDLVHEMITAVRPRSRPKSPPSAWLTESERFLAANPQLVVGDECFVTFVLYCTMYCPHNVSDPHGAAARCLFPGRVPLGPRQTSYKPLVVARLKTIAHKAWLHHHHPDLIKRPATPPPPTPSKGGRKSKEPKKGKAAAAPPTPAADSLEGLPQPPAWDLCLARLRTDLLGIADWKAQCGLLEELDGCVAELSDEAAPVPSLTRHTVW